MIKSAMIVARHALAALAGLPFVLPAAADELSLGFEQEELVPPGPNAVLRTLSSGDVVFANGSTVDLYSGSGQFVLHLGTFATPGPVGLFRVAPDESFVLVGQRETGAIYRMALDGSGQAALVSLPGNADGWFESDDEVLISASTGTAGPGFELWRLKLLTVRTELILEIPGEPGPLVVEEDGGVVLATRSELAPPPAGSSDVLRVDAADLVPVTEVVYGFTDDLMALEIETVPPAGDWVAETDLGGFTGESYYRWDGPNLFGSPGSGVLAYPFHVTQAGTYQLRIRNRHENPDSTSENDCWARMDGGEWVKVFSGGSGSVGQWNWATTFDFEVGQDGPAHYDLGPGQHLLELSGRSKNFMMDRFHLYLDGTPNPKDETTPQAYQHAPGLEIADVVAGGLDGADSLALDPELGTIFLAETSAATGTSRVHALESPFPTPPVVVDTEGAGLVRNLEFVPVDEPGVFFPFQPAGNGYLSYLREDAGTGALQRLRVAPARARLTITGPGTIGFGPVQLELTGAWPNQTVMLFTSPATALAPAEEALLLNGLPLVHTAFSQPATSLLQTPLPVDGAGTYSLGFFNDIGVPQVLGFQFLIFDPAAEVVGTSQPQLL